MVFAPRERARAIERAGHWPIDEWPWACHHRARTEHFRAHPSAFRRLLGDPRVVRGGASVRDLVLDLTVMDEADVYVSVGDLAAIVDDYALITSSNPNITIRVPPSELWLFDGHDAPWPVVVVDLFDAHDDRSIRAARDLAERMAHR